MKNTSASEIIEFFESSFADKHVIPLDLELVWLKKAIGRYIVDFYIASAKIVIELDGSQQYEDTAKHADEERDAYLQSIGCRVLRYSNADVNLRFGSVCGDIYNHLHPHAE